MSDSKIVVCGGGVIGASILYHLTEKGIKPTLIERNHIACAASGKAGGFLARNWCDSSALGPLARKSFDMHSELAQKLGVDCGYRRLDTLSVEANLKKPSNNATTAPSWLDTNIVKASVSGDTASTAQVHPEKFTQALVNAAEKAGATVVIGQVVGIAWDKSGAVPKVTGVHVTVDGKPMEIQADAVVVAMGPWSKWLLGWLPHPASVPSGFGEMLAITAIRAHSILMHPKEHVTPHAIFLSYTNREGSWSDPEIYPRPDGEVYMCGVAKSCDVPINPADVPVDEDAKQILHDVVSSLSTRLKDTPVDKLQACCLPCTSDDKPLIGAIPGMNGLYIATGHSCWGILNAPITGAAMADLLLTGTSSVVDISPFDPKRFTM